MHRWTSELESGGGRVPWGWMPWQSTHLAAFFVVASLSLCVLFATATVALLGAGGRGPGMFLWLALAWLALIAIPVFAVARRTEALVRQSLTDPLTGISNRRALALRLRSELGRASRGREPLSVLMLDVDRLKQINDRHGHVAGDRALRMVALALQRSTRVSDVVGRLAGDEFLVIAPNTEQDRARQLGRRIADCLAEMTRDQQPGPIGISIGVTTTPPAAPEPGSLLAQADAAMYRCKLQGREEAGAELPLAEGTPPPRDLVAEDLLAEDLLGEELVAEDLVSGDMLPADLLSNPLR